MKAFIAIARRWLLGWGFVYGFRISFIGMSRCPLWLPIIEVGFKFYWIGQPIPVLWDD